MIDVAFKLRVVHDRSDTDGDGLALGNRTNLAIKGIIAVGAMSKISSFAGKRADADHYSVCMDAPDMEQ